MTNKSVSPSTIQAEAERLRLRIRKEPRRSARRLLEFAETFAVSRDLQNSAVLLNFSSQLGRLEDEQEDFADQNDVVERMIALVDRIVAEHVEGDGALALQNREKVASQLREHYLRQAPRFDAFFRSKGLQKKYSSGFSLGPIDLTLRPGEITGVVGQNGHGKTTLLRLVAGELDADEGDLSYPMLNETGPRLNWPRIRDCIAFVPQELSVWRGTLFDTLSYEAAIHGVLGEDNKRDVNFIVERLGLGGHLQKRWAQLSGGYRLRFALARALVWKPRILVMDEPLANLDVKAKGLLLQDLRDLATSYSHPIAVIMSSHDLHNLESVCSQMVFLQDGNISFVGDASMILLERPGTEYEIGTSVGIGDVADALSEFPQLFIYQDGLNLVVRATADVSPSDLLRVLLSRGIDLQYFRDNSKSVRRLFQ